MRFLLAGLVHVWRWSGGLLTPPGTCKYHPTCSQYALDALRAHGAAKGSLLACWRLLRCNPWSHGGVDYADGRSRSGQAPAPGKPAAGSRP